MYAIRITPVRVAIGFGKIELQCVICGECQWGWSGGVTGGSGETKVEQGFANRLVRVSGS